MVRDDTDQQLTGRLPAIPSANDETFCYRLHKEAQGHTHPWLFPVYQLPSMDVDALGQRYFIHSDFEAEFHRSPFVREATGRTGQPQTSTYILYLLLLLLSIHTPLELPLQPSDPDPFNPHTLHSRRKYLPEREYPPYFGLIDRVSHNKDPQNIDIYWVIITMRPYCVHIPCSFYIHLNTLFNLNFCSFDYKEWTCNRFSALEEAKAPLERSLFGSDFRTHHWFWGQG